MGLTWIPGYHQSMRPCTLPVLVLFCHTGPSAAEPVRLSSVAFGTVAQIEVRGLQQEAATTAARDALKEIFDLSQLFDPAGEQPGGLGTLNAAVGDGPLKLEQRAGDLLRRGLQYCLWTNGAHGPLGGALYRLWSESNRLPEPGVLRDAVISAQCNRLNLRFEDQSFEAELTPGSRADAVGMGRGFAIDRAVEVLREAGVDNAWLEVGEVWRALGPGPDGDGWLATLPPAPGSQRPIDRVWLRDQSLAIASIGSIDETAGKVRFIDQRTGVPARGVVAVAAVTEMAVDAEALAAAMFISGLREGSMRLGALQPRPSVLWLLGEGKGEPVESTYRWSELDREKRHY